jgi:hypothetical protein
VRLSLLFWLAVVAGKAFAADLQQEDLGSIQEAFRKTNPALDWFVANTKKPVDGMRSVMIVAAAPTAMQPAGPQRQLIRLPVQGKIETGVFVVAGPSNRVQLVLDVFPQEEANGFPAIEQAEAKSVVLSFYADYGFYRDSTKYFFDLASPQPPLKFRYGMLALTSSIVRNGSVVYTGSSLGQGYEVSIQFPSYNIREAPAPPDTGPQAVSLRLPDGRTLLVTNTPVGQTHQLAGMAVVDKSGAREFYPVPVPTMALDRQLRPNEQAPIEIENDIGPVAMDGSTVWFANRFYDGEGTSGVGAVGSFDVRTHKFEMRYLPEIVAWSGSAMRLDGDDLWIGLMRQPEGAAFSGGLLHYNLSTGVVAKFEIPDYIHTIDRVGDTVYCGTSNGLYTVRGGEIKHLAFEPDSTGKLTMITRTSSPRYMRR